MKRKMRGFTLAELLIVVAVIAVLGAVAIPVFSKQLEKSRESVDFANMRSAYAGVLTAAMSDDAGSPLKKADGTFQAVITLKQKEEDWQTDHVNTMRIGNVPYDEWDSKLPAVGGTATVTFYPATEKVIINWGGSGSGSGGGSGGGAEGGSGSGISSFHTAGHDINQIDFCNRGVVLQDQTGTCVAVFSGIYTMWEEFHKEGGLSVAELAETYPVTFKMVDASNIKDSLSETLQAGDLCYDSNKKTFYYVGSINTNEPRPNDEWVPLLQ